jgi:hypothetical protein
MSEKFSTFAGLLTPLPLPLQTTDILVVTRAGVSYEVAPNNLPIVSVSPFHFYVSTTGSDHGGTNTGLNPSDPCATINQALKSLYTFNVFGVNATINLAAGSYAESVFCNQPLTGAGNNTPNPNGSIQPGQIMISGAGSTTTTLTGNAVNSAVICASNYATVGVRALKLIGTGTGQQSTLFAQLDGTINIYDDVNFGAASVEHIHIEDIGEVEAWYSYTVSGNAARHVISASNGGYIHNAYPSGVITFTGGITFSDCGFFADQNGTIQFNSNVTWSGTFTGKRYNVQRGGVISTYPSTSLTWIPGTIAGTGTSGGVYTGTAPPVIVGAITSGGDGTLRQATSLDLSDVVAPNTSWTPGIAFGGSATGITYTSQIGFYTKIGKLVIASFDITLSSKGAQTGAATVTGLPFAANASSVFPCQIGFYFAMSTITGFSAFVNGGASVITLAITGSGDANTSYSNTNFGNTTRISGSVVYTTA